MAVTTKIYTQAQQDILNGNKNLTSDTLKLILVNGYTYSTSHAVYADVSASELSTANGYTAGGVTLTSVAVSSASLVAKLAAANASWTASGGSIGPATGAILRDSTNDRVLEYIDFGGSNTTTTGNTLSINWNASGIVTLSGAS